MTSKTLDIGVKILEDSGYLACSSAGLQYVVEEMFLAMKAEEERQIEALLHENFEDLQKGKRK